MKLFTGLGKELHSLLALMTQLMRLMHSLTPSTNDTVNEAHAQASDCYNGYQDR